MKEYTQFVNNLKSELTNIPSEFSDTWVNSAKKYVDGLASEELRRLISLKARREYGVFFTAKSLARKVLKQLQPSFGESSFIYDPACGAGNLLIAASDWLESKKIKPKNEIYLAGTDLHPEFSNACVLRLTMNYILQRQDKFNTLQKIPTYYSVTTANGLIDNPFYKQATHIFINPPFNQTDAHDKLEWAKGNVSMAALFIDKAIQYCLAGTEIIAILPDVLRSGTRYARWRKMINECCIVKKNILLGQFDKHTDVDVYAVLLVKRKDKILPNEPEQDVRSKKQTIADLFDICVGPVVDNRDSHEGVSRPYVVSKGLKAGAVQKDFLLSRRHEGKSFTSPFLVIKRISRMGDKNRVSATIIEAGEPVYVDNHLIVLIPKSGTMKDCRLAVKLFKHKQTERWINKHIRCRHLTLSLLGKLPVWK